MLASMVPTRLPAVPGCEVASVYVPAGDGGEIGGDFLDVFALDGEAWAFMLGDVSTWRGVAMPDATSRVGPVRTSSVPRTPSE